MLLLLRILVTHRVYNGPLEITVDPRDCYMEHLCHMSALTQRETALSMLLSFRSLVTRRVQSPVYHVTCRLGVTKMLQRESNSRPAVLQCSI